MEDNDSEGEQQGAATGSEPEAEADTDEEEEHFDISLAASHSYMGAGLEAVGGRCVLEAGWAGRVPALAHSGPVFPGETVPMLLPDPGDAALLARAIARDKLFGLLCPDESGALLSGYGVLCEVFEAAPEDAPGGERPAHALSFKARATHRFRLQRVPRQPVPMHLYDRMRFVDVVVLPDVASADPLRRTRLASLDPLRRVEPAPLQRRLRGMDAALTGWPQFVYDIFDYERMRRVIGDHFRTMMIYKLPEEPVSLSFWVAGNLALSPRDRLALFVVDDALQRLHMEVRLIGRRGALCCAACACEIARREDIFAMSSEGVHSNFTNLGGYMHDIVTVASATNTELNGGASTEFTWFPGYAWTIALCAACKAHVGWRFEAVRRALRPQRFYALCRNHVQPRADSPAEGQRDEQPAMAAF